VAPQPKESLDLGVSVVWPEVEVQPILHRLLFRDGNEQEPRRTICGGSDLELIGVVIDDNPAEKPLATNSRARSGPVYR
jgi:hypothetical protein